MTNQQGTEALRLAEEITELMCSTEAAAKTIAAAADELCRLHVENARLAALVDAQQPAPSAAAVVPLGFALHAVEYLGMHNSASRETEMVQMLRKAAQPSPSAASKAVLAAIRAANMQLVRTGDDEFMLVTLKQATPQADSQPAPANTRQIAECYGDCPEDPKTCANPCKFEGRAARAPADSVLEDAARYRWIRGPVEESTRYSRWRIEYWDGPNGWQPMQRERMDSAIDAARKQGGA